MNKNITTFYIVRHGETEWNVKKLLQGHKDSPLTEAGISQAQTLAKHLKQLHFDHVFSSDQLRAKKTAKILAIEHALVVKTTEALRERFFGEYEGQTFEKFEFELRDLMKKYIDLSDKEKSKFKFAENIESDEDVVNRVLLFLRESAIAYQNQTILIVTHGGLMKALLIHLGFGTYNSLPGSVVGNTALIKLESDGSEFWIRETKGITQPKRL